MILSVSRRTDIPAFYSDWFFNRIHNGFLLTRNPFNYNQISRIDLSPNNIEAIVFWTRNPEKMLSRLNELAEYRYYFQYTITGYPRLLEKSVPNPYRAIDTFQNLSNLIGKKKVIWRYDPILISNHLPVAEHKRLFEKIASNLAGYTEKVVISFADFYKKTERNLNKIENANFIDIVEDNSQLYDLVDFIAKTSKYYDLKIQSCSELIDLDDFEILHGKCIDNQLLSELFNFTFNAQKDNNQREACGCIKSIDIGVYNTCLHGCSYCYATYQHDKAVSNFSKHNPHSAFLLGDDSDVPPELLKRQLNQGSLF